MAAMGNQRRKNRGAAERRRQLRGGALAPHVLHAEEGSQSAMEIRQVALPAPVFMEQVSLDWQQRYKDSS